MRDDLYNILQMVTKYKHLYNVKPFSVLSTTVILVSDKLSGLPVSSHLEYLIRRDLKIGNILLTVMFLITITLFRKI